MKRSVYWLRRVRREVRDVVLRAQATDPKTLREDVAVTFLRGDGIEIGALDYPLRMPRGARVRYVDYLDGAGLASAYSENLSAGRSLVAPDVIDDGARLSQFADCSLDFVVANHMLEHVEDPVSALRNQLRVLHIGGILYLTLPNASECFDAVRPRTTVAHLLCDHHEGPAISRREHYEECARYIEGHKDVTVHARVLEMEAEGLRPHFHVWEPQTFAAFLAVLDLPFAIDLIRSSVGEFIVVLRKIAGS